MSATDLMPVRFTSEEVDGISERAYAMDDDMLVLSLMMSLGLVHQVAEQEEDWGLHNAGTVAKCTFEVMVAREWIPVDSFVKAIDQFAPVDDEEADDAS